jgi:hypothetical protein
MSHGGSVVVSVKKDHRKGFEPTVIPFDEARNNTVVVVEKKRLAVVVEKDKIRNTKKPKVETGQEWWSRVSAEKGKKDSKKVVVATKKMIKQGKIQKIDSYFNK